MEERAFYIKLAVHERWGRRELERQMNAAMFEQAILGKLKLSKVLKETHAKAGLLDEGKDVLEARLSRHPVVERRLLGTR